VSAVTKVNSLDMDLTSPEEELDASVGELSWEQPPQKRARTDGGEGGWTCAKCGNFNFEGRVVCNRRTCSAPKDGSIPPVNTRAGDSGSGEGGGWTCVKCGNFNFEGRTVCNRRVCSAPREASMPGPIMPAHQNFNTGRSAGHNALSDGSGSDRDGWICVKCGNHNFEGRIKCNRRTCSAPREESLPGPNVSAPEPFNIRAPGGPGILGGGGEGGWTCVKCGNFNFEGRMVCNRRTCSAPREQSVRVPIVTAPQQVNTGCGSGGGISMGSGVEGGWDCKLCGNHNYEGRIYCNRRTCSAPGPWTCSACGNHNFAGRMVCNRKTCSAPMPPPPAGVQPAGAQPRSTVGTPSWRPAMPPARGPAIKPVLGPKSLAASAQPAAQAIAMLQAAGLANVPGVAEGIKTIIATVGPAAAQPGGAAAGRSQGGPGVQAPIKDGSWLCADCGNINFPNRDVCNRKVCSRPRAEVDAGPPPGCGGSGAWG